LEHGQPAGHAFDALEETTRAGFEPPLRQPSDRAEEVFGLYIVEYFVEAHFHLGLGFELPRRKLHQALGVATADTFLKFDVRLAIVELLVARLELFVELAEHPVVRFELFVQLFVRAGADRLFQLQLEFLLEIG
jgi:hypothetical protein